MLQVVEGSITFDFPTDFVVQKLDDTTFYKKHFQSLVQGPSEDNIQTCLKNSQCNVAKFALSGTKSVDFLAVDSQNSELWLIEVKDYRAHGRTKRIDLYDEIAQKVLASLACLLAMRANAAIPDERKFAELALKQTRLKVVLHLEQPEKDSKLYPQVVDPSNVRIKLRQKVRSIDSKAEYSSIAFTRNVPWDAQ
jgi:hypothetical protein